MSEGEDRTGGAASGGAAEDARSGRSTGGRLVEPVVEHVLDPVRERVVDPVIGHVVEPVVEHVVDPVLEHVVAPVATAVGRVLGAAGQTWAGRDATIARRLKRQAREPLPNLFELYPEARNATPQEIGVRFVPLDEIAGTAVAGATQRGGDFLPLRQFRSENWHSRWQRIQRANEQLIPLPPVDLVKYGDAYWIEDGHNRVAAALYAGGAGVDAVVRELVPLGGRRTETPSDLLPLMADAAGIRAAVFEATTRDEHDDPERAAMDALAAAAHAEHKGAEDEANAGRTQPGRGGGRTEAEPLDVGRRASEGGGDARWGAHRSESGDGAAGGRRT